MTSSERNFGHNGGSPDAVTATIGAGGAITGWSRQAERLLGYRAAEVVGRSATDLLMTRKPSDAAGLSLIDSREWSGTAALRHRDGHRIELTLHAYPSLDGEGRTRGFVVTATTGSAAAEHDRLMVDWAFAQSSIALSTYTTESRSWQLNAAARADGLAENVRRARRRTGICSVRTAPTTDSCGAYNRSLWRRSPGAMSAMSPRRPPAVSEPG